VTNPAPIPFTRTEIMDLPGFAAEVTLPPMADKFYMLFKVTPTPPTDTAAQLPAHGALGVDVSAHQNNAQPDKQINFAAIKNSGRTWAYVRATLGTEGRDQFFIQNFKASKAAGLLTGAYHYLIWDLDGREQARNFLNALGQDIGHLPLVLDLEPRGIDTAIDKARCMANIAGFLAEVESKTTRPIMIYTNNSALDKMITGLDRAKLVKYPLWIASYPRPPANLANVPRPTPHWLPAALTAWQYQGGTIAGHDPAGGRIVGIHGAIDLNVWL
jgi:lysozyme